MENSKKMIVLAFCFFRYAECNKFELANNYFRINYYYAKSDMKTVCIGFMRYRNRYILLGANFMHGYDMIFDKEKSLLGIVPSDCSRRNIMWNQMKGIKPEQLLPLLLLHLRKKKF